MKKNSILPEWFDYKKYKRAESFDCVDWWENVDMRLSLLNHLSNKLKITEEYLSIANSTRNIGAIIYPYNISTEEYKELTQKQILGESNNYNYKNDSNTRHVSFNLSFDDTEISEAFEIYLESQRKNISPIKKRFTTSDFKSWCDSGVLPYLDLKIWSKENKIKMTDYNIAELIFINKPNIDPAAALRQTTKKHLKRIDESGNLLKDQGILERYKAKKREDNLGKSSR